MLGVPLQSKLSLSCLVLRVVFMCVAVFTSVKEVGVGIGRLWLRCFFYYGLTMAVKWREGKTQVIIRQEERRRD